MNPQITVIVPNYNKVQYIEECINSLKLQTMQNFECIFVDDGSTDNSKWLVQNLVKDDARFKLFFNNNHGVAYSRNFAIQHASAEFIMPLDSDDNIERTYFDRALEWFARNPQTTLYYGRWFFIGKDYREWNMKYKDLRYSSYADLLKGNSIHNSCVYRKEDAQKCGMYNETLNGFEDWEFLIRLLYKDKIVAWDPQISYYYRRLDSSRNVNDNNKQAERTAAIYNANKQIFDEFQVKI